MICPNCKKEIDESAYLEFKGTANVIGTATINQFDNVGIVWTAQDSSDEEAKCPHCNTFISVWKRKCSECGVKLTKENTWGEWTWEDDDRTEIYCKGCAYNVHEFERKEE